MGLTVRFDLTPLWADVDRMVPSVLKDDGQVLFAAHRREPILPTLTPNDNRFALGTRVVYRLAAKDARLIAVPNCGYDERVKHQWTQPDARPSYRLRAEGRLRTRADYSIDVTDLLLRMTPGNGCEVGPVHATELVTALVQPRIELALRDRLAALTNELRPLVTAKLNPIWQFLANPIALDRNTTLQLSPQRVDLAQPRFDGDDKLAIAVGMQFKPEARVGTPPKTGAAPALPLANLADRIDNQFRVFLPVYVEKEAIEEELKRNWGGRWIELPEGSLLSRRKIRIDDVTVATAGEFIAFSVRFSWDKLFGGGTLFVAGRPRYDAGSKILRLQDLEFALASRNLLTKAVGALGRDTIKAEMQKSASFGLGGEEARLREHFVQAMNRDLGGLRIQTKVMRFELQDVALDGARDALRFAFLTEGSSSLDPLEIKATNKAPAIKSITVHVDVFDEPKDSPVGIGVALQRDGRNCELHKSWGAGELWREFTQHRHASSACFAGTPVSGQYRIDIKLFGEGNLDLDHELYVEIEDDQGGRLTSPLWFLQWRNKQRVAGREFAIRWP